MTVAEQLYQKIQNLPEAIQLEALHYVDFLAQRQHRQPTIVDKRQKAQAWLKMMSQTPHAYRDIDPLVWQKEQRTDRPLPQRD